MSFKASGHPTKIHNSAPRTSSDLPICPLSKGMPFNTFTISAPKSQIYYVCKYAGFWRRRNCIEALSYVFTDLKGTSLD